MVLPWGLTDPGYPRLPQSTGADASAATLGNARWCGGAQAIVLAPTAGTCTHPNSRVLGGSSLPPDMGEYGLIGCWTQARRAGPCRRQILFGPDTPNSYHPQGRRSSFHSPKYPGTSYSTTIRFTQNAYFLKTPRI